MSSQVHRKVTEALRRAQQEIGRVADGLRTGLRKLGPALLVKGAWELVKRIGRQVLE